MNILAQCCGIVIMGIILFFFLTQKKLKLHTTHAFIAIWTIVFCALIFDILSIIAIQNRQYLPDLLVIFICKIYLWTIISESLVALWYVCVDISNSRKNERNWIFRTSVTSSVSAVVIAFLPIHIYCKDGAVYTYGSSVIATYLVAMLNLAVIFYMVYKYKRQMNPRRRGGVIAWLIIWCIAAAIQFLNNRLLVVGFASVLGILVTYLILENPVSNIDADTGFFNLNALFTYMRELQGRGKNVSILCVRYDNNRNNAFSFETENNISKEVVAFISGIKEATTFRSSASEYIMVFNERDEAEAAIDCIQDRFDKPWGNDKFRMLPLELYFMVSTEKIRRANDILSIFQCAKQDRAKFHTSDVMVIDNYVINRIYEEKITETMIIEALNEDRVEVFYQPIYSTGRKRFTTAEALVRIRARDGEIIPPGKFIGVAEKSGLIIRLGEYVFENVCKLLVAQDLKKLGIEYVEINLSVIQCAYENLAVDFIRLMEKYNVDPGSIVLEITESASIVEKAILLENMNRLRKVGVRFALDDFGTGQCNLNYIVEMPVDIVKFDSVMTKAYFKNGKGKLVMDAAMGMIHKLNLEIVSEGIEEKKQFERLDDLGIDYIQGYYFSKPKEQDDFISFIKENNQA